MERLTNTVNIQILDIERKAANEPVYERSFEWESKKEFIIVKQSTLISYQVRSDSIYLYERKDGCDLLDSLRNFTNGKLHVRT